MQIQRAQKQFEAQIHELFCMPEVYEFLADGSPPPSSVASSWIESSGADAEQYGGGLWVLTKEPFSTVKGLVRLSGGNNGELELTYILHPAFWGLGLATRMAHTAIDQAFISGKTNTIWAGADKPNVRSIAVLKRLGMQFRREVRYPMGLGLEYEMKHSMFYREKIELLESE